MSTENLPVGWMPRSFFSRHSAQLFERAPSLREWSYSGCVSCFVSAQEAEICFLSPVVPFRCRRRRRSFSETTSLTVVHWMSGNTWSYWRLAAYGFLRLSEGASGEVGDSRASRTGLTSPVDTSPRNRASQEPDSTTGNRPRGRNGLSARGAQTACDFDSSHRNVPPSSRRSRRDRGNFPRQGQARHRRFPPFDEQLS